MKVRAQPSGIQMDRFSVRAYRHSHITHKHPDICRLRCQLKPCLEVCPTEVFRWDDGDEKVLVRHGQCIECSACVVVCPEANIVFSYPPGGYGVTYTT